MSWHEHPKSIGLLCSGFGLGFYIPGLLIQATLRRLGIATHVEVFETAMSQEKIGQVEKARTAYHDNFKVALASQRVPSDITQSLDEKRVAALLTRWRNARVRDFICMSGHWVFVLDRYRAEIDYPIRVHLLHLDADLTPSWRQLKRIHPHYAQPYEEVKLYDGAALQVMQCIDANAGPVVPYSERNSRLVVHGGGWGMGTFQEAVPRLESAGFGLDIACYGPVAAGVRATNRRYFMDDPSWRTWHRNAAGEHTFPPFAEIKQAPADFRSQSQCHGLHRIIRHARAIVSKPGAGTLVDSFASATPLVMLEPFGEHEARNAAVWRTSGFGIDYHEWAAAGHPLASLQELHRNLLEHRTRVPDYAQRFAALFRQDHGGRSS